MPERTGRIRGSKVLTLSIDERIFGKSENRFGMVPGRNIKVMISRSAKAQVPFMGSLSILDSTRASVIKPRLFSVRSRKSVWNECLHSRDNHLRDALGTHRGIPALEAVIIPREIREVQPQVVPPS